MPVGRRRHKKAGRIEIVSVLPVLLTECNVKNRNQQNATTSQTRKEVLMLVLLDTSEDLTVAASELGMDVGQLITPLTRFVNRGGTFAIDNGGYSQCSPDGFVSLLEREEVSRQACLFVAVPDVVADARRTLELFDYWYTQIGKWPLALVAQDGLEDLSIPWKLISAVFIGGSTSWKHSRHAESIIKCAQWQKKWVHVGRVNGAGAVRHFEKLNIDSIDGTGLSRYTHMRDAVRLRYTSRQMHLLTEYTGGQNERS